MVARRARQNRPQSLEERMNRMRRKKNYIHQRHRLSSLKYGDPPFPFPLTTTEPLGETDPSCPCPCPFSPAGGGYACIMLANVLGTAGIVAEDVVEMGLIGESPGLDFIR